MKKLMLAFLCCIQSMPCPDSAEQFLNRNAQIIAVICEADSNFFKNHGEKLIELVLLNFVLIEGLNSCNVTSEWQEIERQYRQACKELNLIVNDSTQRRSVIENAYLMQ